MTRHENDVVFRTRKPKLLAERMAKAAGTLRMVGQPDDAGLLQVYYRPPKQYFEADTLLAVLCKRLAAPERSSEPTPVGQA